MTMISSLLAVNRYSFNQGVPENTPIGSPFSDSFNKTGGISFPGINMNYFSSGLRTLEFDNNVLSSFINMSMSLN